MEVLIDGLSFSSNFDSGNLARVESVKPAKQGKSHSSETPDLEFNLWTKVDAAETEFQNSYRSWFFFSVKGSKLPLLVKFNIKNMNRHSKVFTNHMYPVYMVSGHHRWQKIKEKPAFLDGGENAVLSFLHPIEAMQKVFFALCYPYPYRDVVSFLNKVDAKYSSINKTNFISEDIYYYRECLCHSLEGRSIDLITITSTWGISREREARLPNLFPNSEVPRPHCFPNKKVIFITARVHPAETSSSFVIDGIISSLINKEDPGAALLRKKFIFKLIPMLNPDGVVRGHYRTDSRGVNLNRVYGKPSFDLYPSIYAACAVIRYHHESQFRSGLNEGENMTEDSEILLDGKVPCPEKDKEVEKRKDNGQCSSEGRNSGLYLYLDLHSHASRKGFFLYGNNFTKLEDCIETRVFARLMEINCRNFLYSSCDFSEATMHLKDKKGNGSREGAGRVWVMKETGINYAYTFEAHYNTGKAETCIPRRTARLESKNWISFIQSEFTTPSYEGVGRAILQSILDLTGPNMWSRLSTSKMKSLTKIREVLHKELMYKVTYKTPLAKMMKPTVKVGSVSSLKMPPGGIVKKSVVKTKPPTQNEPVKELCDVKNAANEDTKVKEHKIMPPVSKLECTKPEPILLVPDNVMTGIRERSSLHEQTEVLEKLEIYEPAVEIAVPNDESECCPPL